MKQALKQSYLNTLEELAREFQQGNKSQAFKTLCALVGEILKELPTDGNNQQ